MIPNSYHMCRAEVTKEFMLSSSKCLFVEDQRLTRMFQTLPHLNAQAYDT